VKYKVVLSGEAEKVLRRLERQDYLLVLKELHSLEEQAWPEASASVVGTTYLRLRVRRFRIIYEVDSRQKTVYVKRIARRNEQTYKGL
jgi:mRNA-degrading endonuclease RelE of RelBE toxin-antitoxin system